jgi:hypothetical protein
MEPNEQLRANSKHPRPTSPRKVVILAAIVGISGILEALVGALLTSGSITLAFLVSDFRSVGQAIGGFGPLVAGFGLVTIVASAGLWRGKPWAFALALVLSLVEIALGGVAHDFVSFTFIRGVVVLLYLVRVRDYFLRSVTEEPIDTPDGLFAQSGPSVQEAANP